MELYKKEPRNIESNYRPVSIFYNLFVTGVWKMSISHVSSFFEEKVSKYQCKFDKRFSAQQCPVEMIEN